MLFARLAKAEDYPAGLNLPWATPLEDWPDERCTDVERGLHRNPVRFVAHEGAIYAIKELLERVAEREYALLRSLEESMRLLKRNRIDILMVHEPDRPGQYDWWPEPWAYRGPVIDLLRDLKRQGVVGHIGLGGTTTLATGNAVRMDRDLKEIGIHLDESVQVQ
mgnify:CR=1 FL=1